MLTVLSPSTGKPNRRGFLRLGSLGLAGLTLPNVLQAQEKQTKNRKGTAVILYWMAGGPSHIDTFDPKPDAPVEVRGPFGSIPTRTSGMRFTDQLPNLARVSNRFSILRSVTHAESNHPDASHLIQTGYHEKNVQFRGQIYPAQGSIVAKLRGADQKNIPPYVCIPDAYFARQGFFQKATFLGKEFDPINSGSEAKFRFTSASPSFTLPTEMTIERAGDRRELMRRLDGVRKNADPTVSRMDSAYRQAFDLVTSAAAKDAFDISRESESTRAKYGLNPWGRSALLARRLVEAGVTFVTVNHYEADVDWWDDHTVIEKGLKKRLPPFDQSLAALIEDIHDRGLAERVLVVAMGEFGRSPRIDAQAGRGHWSKAMNVLLAGGGLKNHQLIGATTNNGGEPSTHAHSPGDLLATIYHVLGIDAENTTINDQTGRPIRIVPEGTPIRELVS